MLYPRHGEIHFAQRGRHYRHLELMQHRQQPRRDAARAQADQQDTWAQADRRVGQEMVGYLVPDIRNRVADEDMAAAEDVEREERIREQAEQQQLADRARTAEAETELARAVSAIELAHAVSTVELEGLERALQGAIAAGLNHSRPAQVQQASKALVRLRKHFRNEKKRMAKRAGRARRRSASDESSTVSILAPVHEEAELLQPAKLRAASLTTKANLLSSAALDTIAGCTEFMSQGEAAEHVEIVLGQFQTNDDWGRKFQTRGGWERKFQKRGDGDDAYQAVGVRVRELQSILCARLTKSIVGVKKRPLQPTVEQLEEVMRGFDQEELQQLIVQSERDDMTRCELCGRIFLRPNDRLRNWVDLSCLVNHPHDGSTTASTRHVPPTVGVLSQLARQSQSYLDTDLLADRASDAGQSDASFLTQAKSAAGMSEAHSDVSYFTDRWLPSGLV